MTKLRLAGYEWYFVPYWQIHQPISLHLCHSCWFLAHGPKVWKTEQQQSWLWHNLEWRRKLCQAPSHWSLRLKSLCRHNTWLIFGDRITKHKTLFNIGSEKHKISVWKTSFYKPENEHILQPLRANQIASISEWSSICHEDDTLGKTKTQPINVRSLLGWFIWKLEFLLIWFHKWALFGQACNRPDVGKSLTGYLWVKVTIISNHSLWFLE